MPANTERDELHRAIWAIADDLRGSVDGWDFKQYILGVMFYRYISEHLEKYIDMEIYRSNNVLFELVGIISHIGSLEYGHYYSLVKNCSSNIWYKFSDNLYEIVDFDKINKKDVCILIYNIK